MNGKDTRVIECSFFEGKGKKLEEKCGKMSRETGMFPLSSSSSSSLFFFFFLSLIEFNFDVVVKRLNRGSFVKFILGNVYFSNVPRL